MKYVLAWLVLALALIGISGRSWWSCRRIAVHGVEGQGRVIELLPKNHGAVRYEYQVAGRVFQGQTQPKPPNPQLEQLELGQSMVIFYDPENPEHSLLGNPQPIFKNLTISLAVMITGLPTFIVLRWAWWRSRKRRQRGLSA